MRRRGRPRILGASALLGLVVLSAPAAAGDRAVVELVLEVDPPDRIIGTTLERHLRAELGARDIDVSLAPATAARPIARVTLHVEHQARGAFLATIRIGDLIMDKRVERTIDLGQIPADGRALAVAASADELLRASWAELTIADAPRPLLAPPPAVTRALSAPSRAQRARPSLVEIGAVGTGVDFFGHRVGVGGEAWIGFWCLSRLAVQLRFAADAGLARTSRDGSARADTLGPGVAVVAAVMNHDAPLGVRFEADAKALRVRLIGEASGAAVVSEGTRWTGVAGATVRGWARTGPVSWTVGAGVIAALHAVAATDDGTAVTSIAGVGGKLDAGLAFSFR